MSSCKAEQEEEAEVLLSIYEGDSLFKQVRTNLLGVFTVIFECKGKHVTANK